MIKQTPRILFLFAAFAVFAAHTAQAHTQSSAYLMLHVAKTGLTGEWSLALRDLDDAIGLDINDDGVITWGELRSRKEAISAYALSRLHIQGDGQTGSLHVNEFLVDDLSDGAYAVLRFDVEGIRQARRIEVNYNAFFDIDPKHRGLLRLEHNGQTQLAVFRPAMPSQAFDLEVTAPQNPFFTFLKEGVWHIWSGYDHILFLLALLLPGVLRRRDGKWQPVDDIRPAIVSVLKVVTAFTVAHSITLSLAVLGFVHLPTRLVESAIAASVVVAAFNNLVPLFPDGVWMVAFGFGLLHGFGFANALRDRPATRAARGHSLRFQLGRRDRPVGHCVGISPAGIEFAVPGVLPAVHTAHGFGGNRCRRLHLAGRARFGFQVAAVLRRKKNL